MKLKRAFASFAAIAVLAGALVGTAAADKERPNTQGHLHVLTTYRTLDAVSWDARRWPWKANHDLLGMEPLVRGDLSRGPRGTNESEFALDDHIPEDMMEGALAEHWVVEPDRITFTLRDNVYWQAIPGVMEKRKLVAADVVKHFQMMDASPHRVPEIFDFVERWEAPDERTVIAHLKEFHANWFYNWGWGFRSGIMPPEYHALSDEQRADWRYSAGTGPYRVADVQRGRHQTYVANPHYWDTETIDGQEYRLPLNQGVTYHIIRDEAAAVAALIAGQVDIMETLRWQFVDRVRRSAPEIKMLKRLESSGTYIALRNDIPPFNDVRVRRAMNLAIDQRAILRSVLNGDGELLNYPFNVAFTGYYESIEELPPEAQELFEYKPERAKELLAEAGYPDGFEFTLQVNAANSYHLDLATMLQAYYERIGLKMTIQALDYAPFLSQMGRDTQAPAYLMNNSSGNPLSVLRKSFLTGQTWNAARFSDEHFDEVYRAATGETDDEKRREMLKSLNRYILTEKVPHVWLPTQVRYTAWWPWVKNYAGELRVGAMMPNAIYARVWIDEQMKQEMLRGGRR